VHFALNGSQQGGAAISPGGFNLLGFKIKHGQKSATQTRVIYSRNMLAQDVLSARLFPISNGIAEVRGRLQKERKPRLLGHEAKPVHFVGYCHDGRSVAGFKRYGKAQDGQKPIPDLSTLQILRTRMMIHIRFRQL
jgi:hypothetical protein